MNIESIRLFQSRVVELRDYFKSRISKSNKIDNKKVFSAECAAYILVNREYENMRKSNDVPDSPWIESVMDMRDNPQDYEDKSYYDEANYFLWVEVLSRKQSATEGYTDIMTMLMATYAFTFPKEFMAIDEQDFSLFNPYSIAELIVKLNGVEIEEDYARRFFRWVKN